MVEVRLETSREHIAEPARLRDPVGAVEELIWNALAADAGRVVVALADTSAVWRLLRGQLAAPWPDRVARGLVAVCPPVESELMPGLRADRDFEPFFTMLGQTFGWVRAVDDPWPKVIAVQRDLVKIGHHRGWSPLGILIALTAGHHGLTLLHVDDDFVAIAKVRPGLSLVRGQPPTI